MAKFVVKRVQVPTVTIENICGVDVSRLRGKAVAKP